MMMMVEEDEWVAAAMTDDSMVAELLLRIKHSSGASRPRVPPIWGLRRSRTKPASSQKEDCNGAPTRFSPVTPLSWSGGTTGSPSNNNGVDGFEASSQMNCFSPISSRSKGIVANEAVFSINKKSRKRKTYAELKEEENMLAQERTCLNKERENLEARYKDYTATNERLKRLKEEQNLQHTVNARLAFDQLVQPHFSSAHQMEDHNMYHTMNFNQGMQAYSNHAHHTEVSTSTQAALLLPKPEPGPSLVKIEKTEATQKTNFILPDLNETPSENESG